MPTEIYNGDFKALKFQTENGDFNCTSKPLSFLSNENSYSRPPLIQKINRANQAKKKMVAAVLRHDKISTVLSKKYFNSYTNLLQIQAL